MLRPRHKLLALFVAALSAMACDPAAAPRHASGLQLVDTIIVRETDAAYLGRPVTIAASDRWGFFVPDVSTHAVHHIARNGDMRDQIGRYGSGPGEFLAPTGLALVHDSILIISDAQRLGIFERNLNTGVQGPLLSLGAPTPFMAATGDTVVAAYWFLAENSLFAKWRLGDDSVMYFGTMPPSLRSTPAIRVRSHVTLAVWTDTVLYHAGFSDHLHLMTTAGRVIDSIPIPRVRRRGVPPGIVWTSADLLNHVSLVTTVGRLRDGRLVVLHNDLTTTVGRRAASSAVYATVISREQRNACVDLPVSVDRSTILRTVLHGDTLITLDQVVTDDRATGVIRKYVFPPGMCEALPL